MDPKTLPDQPRSGSIQTLTTIANVAAIMAEASITARYNLVTKNVEITLPGHAGTPDNLDNVTLAAVHSLAAEHGMPTGSVGEYVNAIADQNAFNPVADWIDGQPWDGTDRLPDFYDTVKQQREYPWELKDALLRKWLRSAAAAAVMPNYKGRGVLTLQGPQGIGKTSWVSALVPEPGLRGVVKIDHHLDAGNKDSIIGAIENWIVEIGELDSSFRKDVARLKGLLTSDSDRVRRHYDRRISTYDRRTVFAATVNQTDFLVDATGNSRWWTIAVDDLDFRHGIDMQQLFAQVAAEVRAGAPWWLDRDEEEALARWNERHASSSVVADLLDRWLDLDIPVERRVPRTPTEVLKQIGVDHPTNGQAKECAGLLRQLLGPSVRIGGSNKWRAPLRQPNADDLHEPEHQPARRGMVNQPGDVF